MTPQDQPVYAGHAKPFSFALEPLSLEDWIVTDSQRDAQLAEKQRLFDRDQAAVFYETPGALSACLELEALLSELGATTHDDDDSVHPLWRCARQVQEDLLILQEQAPQEWHLTAASLSFPSKWRLQDKAGKRLDAIHAPVPGFGPGARNASMMARMFTKMQPDKPMLRHNWTLDSQAQLYRPDGAPLSGPAAEPLRLVRVERQTLVKLPRSRAIVFGIHIYLDPLEALADQPVIVQQVIEQLRKLTPDQALYKCFACGVDPAIQQLECLLASQST